MAKLDEQIVDETNLTSNEDALSLAELNTTKTASLAPGEPAIQAALPNPDNPATGAVPDTEQPTSSEGELNVIDADATETAPAALEKPLFISYNAEKYHDEARKHIAISLLILLAVVILLFMLGLLALAVKPNFDQYKTILEMLLTPILTLVSAATGFYFGSKK